jgi:magnesium-protoporphyrin IX monomethyl ester (oxidative) cyclase
MLLINTSSKYSTRIFQSFYPIHPPVGIGYIMSYAQSQGIEVGYLDQQVEKDVMARVEERVKKMTQPYIFGFSVLTAGYKDAVELSRQIRGRWPDSYIVWGGTHPSMDPEEAMENQDVDFVIRGEGEGPMVDLYRVLKEGSDYSKVDNLSYRKNGKIVHNPTNYLIKDLDSMPSFPYHIFAHEKRYDMGFITSSRGCPYECIFCSIAYTPGGRKYRYRSAKAIADDLELLYTKFNVTNAIFLDDNFLVNRKRIYGMIQEIKGRGLHDKVRLVMQARGDGIDRAMLQDMFDAGFKTILFGIETASEDVMVEVKKGETVQEVVEGIHVAKDIGYYVSGTFIFGLPGDTHQERMDCLDMAKELGLNEVRFNNAVPYPGTEMYKTAKKEGLLNVQGHYENFIAVSAITESVFSEVPLAYVPKGCTEDEIKRDVLLCSVAAYLSVINTVKIISQKDSTTKWFSFGQNTLERIKKIPAAMYLGLMLGFKSIKLFYTLFIKQSTALPLKEVTQALFCREPSRRLLPALVAGKASDPSSQAPDVQSPSRTLKAWHKLGEVNAQELPDAEVTYKVHELAKN